MILKRFVLSHLNAQQRLSIKKRIRRIKSKVYFWIKPLTIEQMESILTKDLKIKEGDRIFVTSAFGSLNACFSPQELIELLMRIVGEEGNIMMPFYPPGSSYEWAVSGEVFDMKQTKSSMGVVTNVFSMMSDVIKSHHPTKAVCVWGKDAERIASGHSQCETPFAESSPYGKLYHLGSKSVGLAAVACPMGHCMEDLLNLSRSQYYPNYFNIKIKNDDDYQICKTLVHNLDKLLIAPSDYIENLSCLIKIRTGFACSFSIDNNQLFNYYKYGFENGNSPIRMS